MKPLIRRILTVGGICSLLISGCSSTEKRPLSDHYDGRRFYNPTQPEMHGLWTAVKFLASAQPAPWPEFVENRPDSHLGLWTRFRPGSCHLRQSCNRPHSTGRLQHSD
jgi:hypothetical protein